MIRGAIEFGTQGGLVCRSRRRRRGTERRARKVQERRAREISSGTGRDGAHGSALKGMLVMALAVIAYPLVDALAKLLSRELPVLEIVWARYALQSVAVLPFVLWRHGWASLVVREGPLQVTRAGFHLATATLFFLALPMAPLSDCLATFFVSPIIITLLAVPLLGERIGAWRAGAVIAGFIGILLITRPGFGAVSLGLLLAFASGCTHALFAITSRRLAGSDPPLVGTLLIGLLGAVTLGLAMPMVWVWPDPRQWLLLACIGGFAALCQWLVTLAYEHSPASHLAPVGYLEIVSATVLGFLLFGDFPAPVTWIGIAIVIASGIVIAWREQVRRQGRNPGQ